MRRCVIKNRLARISRTGMSFGPPPPATHFLVTAPATATAGVAISVTVAALDATNHAVPTYLGTVTFSSSDTAATLAANATLTAGTGTFAATLNTAGTQTVTATDTVTEAITGVSGNITPVYILNGIVSYWKLDETTTVAGATIVDSADSNTGTPAGAAGSQNLPQPSTDVPGAILFSDLRSLNFDGTDDKVTSADTNLPTGNGARSWSAWIKTTSAARQGVLSYGTPTSSRSVNFNIFSDSKLLVDIDHFGGDEGNTVVNDGAWHHICAVWTGSAPIQLYVDGTAQTLTTVGSSISSFNTVSNGSCSIGQLADGTNFFNGKIDDVRVYNRALSAAEVAALAAGNP